MRNARAELALLGMQFVEMDGVEIAGQPREQTDIPAFHRPTTGFNDFAHLEFVPVTRVPAFWHFSLLELLTTTPGLRGIDRAPSSF